MRGLRVYGSTRPIHGRISGGLDIEATVVSVGHALCSSAVSVGVVIMFVGFDTAWQWTFWIDEFLDAPWWPPGHRHTAHGPKARCTGAR